MRRILAHCCLTLAIVASIPSLLNAEQPGQSDDFVNSAGINIHLSYTDTLYYQDFPLVESALKTSGIRHVRDALTQGSPQILVDRFNQLGADGFHGLALLAGDEPVPYLEQLPVQFPTYFEGYETPNEVDIDGDSDWVAHLKSYMHLLDSAARSGSAGKSYFIVGPSLVHVPSLAELGDVSALDDFGNIHNYHDGRNPGTSGWGSNYGRDYGSTPWSLRYEATVSGTHRIWSTETGYSNDMKRQGALIESIGALYAPRIYLMGWIYGNPRTYLYELISSGGEDYGLLRANGSPKPAFGAIAQMLNLLADPGPSFTPSPLSYTFSGGTFGLQHLLLQKRDGTYYLAIWLETQLYDVDKLTYTNWAPQPLTIHFDQPLQSATTYQLDASGGMTATALNIGGDISVKANTAVQFVKINLGPNVVHLNVQPSDASAGSLAYSPPSPDGAYTRGQSVTIDALPHAGFAFKGFTGDLTSAASPLTVLMSSNKSLVAHFACSYAGHWATSPSALAADVPAPRGSTAIAIASGSDCQWSAASADPWITLSSLATHVGNGSVGVTYGVNTGPARTGRVLIGGLTFTLTQDAAQIVAVPLNASTNYGVIDPSGRLTTRVLTHTASAAINVDGTLVSTPATMNWYLGSVHTLSAVQPQFIFDKAYIAFGWGVGNPAPTITLTTTATTSVQHNLIAAALLTTAVNGGGKLIVTPYPVPTDGYYILGQTVSLIATPNQGCIFTGYSGSVSSVSESISLYLTTNRAVTANFSCSSQASVHP